MGELHGKSLNNALEENEVKSYDSMVLSLIKVTIDPESENMYAT